MNEKTDAFPAALDAERTIARRSFLAAFGGALLAVAGAKRLAGWLEAQRAQPLMIAMGAVARLAPGAAVAVKASTGEALAVRLGDGDVVAFNRRCPHLGCPVVWAAERHRFECPCHHAAFDARTGKVLFGPPKHGLEPARIVDAPALTEKEIAT
jgi:nitrite reductase/ring-hydroxylating ferredoxin subunit